MLRAGAFSASHTPYALRNPSMRCRNTGVQRRVLGPAARSWAPSPGVSELASKVRLLMAHRQVQCRRR
eukprot:10023859-Heterocapsa_arctica.AAC.1